MIRLGAKPMTALEYPLELQRDWARTEIYGSTTGIAKIWGGAFKIGVHYAKTTIGTSESHG